MLNREYQPSVRSLNPFRLRPALWSCTQASGSTTLEQELPPVIEGVLEELVGGILPESQPRVADNAPGEIGPDKRQGEDGGEHGQRLCPAQFADAAAAQQGAVPEIFQKGRNPVLQSF